MKLEDEIRQSKFRSEYQKAILNIVFTGNWLSNTIGQRLKPYGISPEQYNVLRILRGQYPEPATVNLVRERMLNRMSNASRLVEKLRLKGLVERKTCDSDRRAVDLLITRAGLELLGKIDKLAAQWENIVSTITAGEAGELNNLLDKLRS